jgi:hypothetical protein
MTQNITINACEIDNHVTFNSRFEVLKASLTDADNITLFCQQSGDWNSIPSFEEGMELTSLIEADESDALRDVSESFSGHGEGLTNLYALATLLIAGADKDKISIQAVDAWGDATYSRWLEDHAVAYRRVNPTRPVSITDLFEEDGAVQRVVLESPLLIEELFFAHGSFYIIEWITDVYGEDIEPLAVIKDGVCVFNASLS